MSFAPHPLDHTKALLVARVRERQRERRRERVGELPEPWVAPPPRARPTRATLRGVAVGAIGATLATLWVLVVDAWRGLPFDTPATLAAHVTYAFGSVGSRSAERLATLFIGVEYVAFAAVGALAALVAHRMHGAWGLLGALLVTAVGVGLPLAALFALTNPAALDAAVRVHVATAHLAATVVMSLLLGRARSRSAPDDRAAGAPGARATSTPLRR